MAMKKLNSLEESLNGGYNGLYGEVVTYDMYHMRDVPDVVSVNDPTYVHLKGHARGFNFTPDVVFDLGANVGIFSRYARDLFPNALIVAVEPDPVNCEIFRQFTNDPKIILLEKAIGKGKIFHDASSINGAMEVYLSEDVGYSKKDLAKLAPTNIESIILPDLKQYIKKGDKVLLKLDIEGNETVLFNCKESMAMMKTFDYITIELHYFAMDGAKQNLVRTITDDALLSLVKTHETSYDTHVYFYAVKKEAKPEVKPVKKKDGNKVQKRVRKTS